MESLIILGIFSNTPFAYSPTGITGFEYNALKDAIKWAGLKPKHYVPILLTCVNYYIKGTHNK